MYNLISAIRRAYDRLTGEKEEMPQSRLSPERVARREMLNDFLLETRLLLQDNAPRIHLAIE